MRRPRPTPSRWTLGCAMSYRTVISTTRPTRTPSELRTGRPRRRLRNTGGSVTKSILTLTVAGGVRRPSASGLAGPPLVGLLAAAPAVIAVGLWALRRRDLAVA